MLYISRHQQGLGSNCLSYEGMLCVAKMASKITHLLELSKTVYTCPPATCKHMRPIQTATNLCTFLDDHTEVHVCMDIKTMKHLASDSANHLVIWHHGDIAQLVNEVTSRTCHFSWPEHNFSGCLLLGQHFINFVPDFWY